MSIVVLHIHKYVDLCTPMGKMEAAVAKIPGVIVPLEGSPLHMVERQYQSKKTMATVGAIFLCFVTLDLPPLGGASLL